MADSQQVEREARVRGDVKRKDVAALHGQQQRLGIRERGLHAVARRVVVGEQDDRLALQVDVRRLLGKLCFFLGNL